MRKESCVFTIVRDEPIFFPLWQDYYRNYFDIHDIHILHHETGDPDNRFDRSMKLFPNVETISYEHTYHHEWLRAVVKKKQRELLAQYKVVVFAEVDEIIWAAIGLRKFIEVMTKNTARCCGIEVVHHFDEEPALEYRRPFLQQRKYGYYSNIYNKTLISKIPLDWCWGFHHCAEQEPEPTPGLYLVHLHKLDFNIAWERNQLASHRHTLREEQERKEPNAQEIASKRDWLKHWWYLNVDMLPDKESRPDYFELPEYIKNVI